MSGGGAIGRSHGSEGKAQSKGEGRGQSIGQGKSQSLPPWRVEETCTSGGGTRKRGDRREVEKGGRDPSLEGALVGAGTRSPGGVHKGLILPPGVQGSGGHHWAGSSGGRDGPPATAAWDHPRGTSQTAQLWAPTGVQASSVPSRLQPGGGVGFPHPCPAEQEEAAEEGWATNLQKVQPAEGTDDLAGLRERQQKLGVEAERPAVEKKEKSKKTKRKEKKEKKEKREKKERLGLAVESSGSSEEVALDGSRARLAARKSLIALFAGTGLDPKEKIRRRVSQKARRAVKKRGKRSSDSSSGGSSGSTEDMGPEAGEEGVFQQESKVRLVAASQPGALAAQALTHMRGLLLSEIGHNDQPGLLKACAVAYYRQCLQRRSTGPAQRELLTICSAVDAAMSGNVAGCLDILLQRLKSAESTLSGTHWSVSQRLEILPQDQASLTPLQEMSSARKDVYEESRLKWLASQPDGRTGGGGSKGSGKTKSDSKDGAKGGDRGRRFGKGTPLKGEGNKKGKEDGAPKA